MIQHDRINIFHDRIFINRSESEFGILDSGCTTTSLRTSSVIDGLTGNKQSKYIVGDGITKSTSGSGFLGYISRVNYVPEIQRHLYSEGYLEEICYLLTYRQNILLISHVNLPFSDDILINRG